MSSLSLLVTASASLVAAGCFLLVGITLRRRRYSPELRSAGQAYVLWWFMFSFEAISDGARVLLGLLPTPPADLYVFLAELKIIAAGIGIWALGRYVLYLRNGQRWVSLPIAGFAILHALFFLWGVQAGLPARIQVDAWSPRLILTGPGIGLPSIGPLTLLFFFLPPIVLSIAYLLLVHRMETRTQRVRIVAIAVAIMVFQLIGAIQWNPKTPANSRLFALLPLISAAVGLVILATYRPPVWVARRFGIEGLSRAKPNGESRHPDF